MNGSIEPLPSVEANGYSGIELKLERGECKYVVFRHDRTKPKVRATSSSFSTLDNLEWTLTFPQGWGVEAPITINRLQPWCELPLSDEGKAFSGTVTYESSFSVGKLNRKARFFIGLG